MRAYQILSSHKHATMTSFILFVLIILAGCQRERGFEAITGDLVNEGGDDQRVVGQEVQQGDIIQVYCTDSDLGDEPTLAGITTTSAATVQDTCKQGTLQGTLIEYYCESSQIKQREYSCKYGCQEGKCLLTAPALVPEPQPVLQPVVQGQPAVTITRGIPLLQVDRPAIEEAMQKQKEQEKEQNIEEKKLTEKEFYNCMNGFKDPFETDVDCGGSCKPCRYGQMCQEQADCNEPLKCNLRAKKCMRTGY